MELLLNRFVVFVFRIFSCFRNDDCWLSMAIVAMRISEREIVLEGNLDVFDRLCLDCEVSMAM